MAEGAHAVQHDPRRRAQMVRKRQRGTAARKVVLQFRLATMKSFQAWGALDFGRPQCVNPLPGEPGEPTVISVAV